MFEQRSKDGRILFVVFYSYQQHLYCVNKYRDGRENVIRYMLSFQHSDLSFCVDFVDKAIRQYNDINPAKQRYYRLASGDIYDNETETVINHNALIGLLGGLESDDNDVIRDAIYDLTQ